MAIRLNHYIRVSPSDAVTIESSSPEGLDLNNADLTGIPTAATASPSTNTTQLATTAYVDTGLGALSANSLTQLDTTLLLSDTGSDGTFTFTADGGAADFTLTDSLATFSGNMIVTGDFTVNGTTTTISTTNLAVEDPLISLATGNDSTDTVDIGVWGLYDTSGSLDLYAGLFRDATDNKWRLFVDSQEAPTTTVNTGATGYAVGTLIVNLDTTSTGTTQSSSDNSTKIATTAYVDAGLGALSSTTITEGNSTIDVDDGVGGAGTLNFTVDAALQLSITASTADFQDNNVVTSAEFQGVATSAQYADLAENYVADAEYEVGTVLSFGGDKEVTVSTSDHDRRIAGTVSEKPAYLMNSALESEFVAPLALQGRVPVKVQGTIRKGDMLVSAGNGSARAEANPQMGAVLGKALEDFDDIGLLGGMIEVVLGRM